MRLTACLQPKESRCEGRIKAAIIRNVCCTVLMVLCVSTEAGKMDADAPDAFQNLLARLKQSQHMHMIADTSEKSSKAAEDLQKDHKER